jgi:type I restriction enzyme, S subunit
MNAERLLQHYHRVADAPDAIARLRRFILDLAVRGKLVPRNATDESASSLLRRLKIVPLEGGPFALPSSWAWVNVATAADTRLGKMLDKGKNKGTPRRYLRNINVRWFDFDLSDVFEMRFEDSEISEFALRSGDVLICEGGEPGRAAVWDEREPDIYFQKAIHRVRFLNFVDSAYFVNALRASADDGRLSGYFTGTGIKHFTGRGLDAYLFPLPPLSEQRRIVATVDELMALCNQLDAARAEREATRDRLTAASLARLNAPDPETFAADANFALDALPVLAARPDQIKQVRQTILDLAVRGKLVRQDPNDEQRQNCWRGLRTNGEGHKRSKRLAEVAKSSFPASEPMCFWRPVGVGQTSTRLHCR